MKSKKILCLLMTALTIGLLCNGCGTKNAASENGENVNNGTDEVTEIETVEDAVEDEVEENSETEVPDKATDMALQVEVSKIYRNCYEEGTSNCFAKVSAETLTLYNEGYDGLKKSLKDFSDESISVADNFAKEAEDAYKEGGEEAMGIGSWFSEFYVHIKRADSRIFSFEDMGSTFTGGAHPYTFSSGWTYDSQTGALLKISDVVNDEAAIKAIIVEKLENHEYKEEFFEDWKDTVEKYFSGEEGYMPVWYMDADGITFTFNPYELAPYATGAISVNIPFTEYPELLKEEYAPIDMQKAYLPDYDYGSYFKDFYIDLDSDGSKDVVSITAEDLYMDEFDPATDYEHADDYKIGMKVKVGLGKNSEEASNPVAEFEAEIELEKAVILENAEGKKYLYLQTRGYSDYRQLYVYEIDNFTLKKLDYTESASFHGFCPTDSSNFMLGDKIDVMGTYFGYRKYHIGEDGLPVADEKLYKLFEYDSYETDRALTLKTDIKGYEVVNIDTFELGDEVTLKKGDVLIPSYSDDVVSMIFKTVDGKYVAVKYDGAADDYPRFVNGIDENEVFDNMMYAG